MQPVSSNNILTGRINMTLVVLVASNDLLDLWHFGQYQRPWLDLERQSSHLQSDYLKTNRCLELLQLQGLHSQDQVAIMSIWSSSHLLLIYYKTHLMDLFPSNRACCFRASLQNTQTWSIRSRVPYHQCTQQLKVIASSLRQFATGRIWNFNGVS